MSRNLLYPPSLPDVSVVDNEDDTYTVTYIDGSTVTLYATQGGEGNQLAPEYASFGVSRKRPFLSGTADAWAIGEDTIRPTYYKAI